jgi:hypothetical protein
MDRAMGDAWECILSNIPSVLKMQVTLTNAKEDGNECTDWDAMKGANRMALEI